MDPDPEFPIPTRSERKKTLKEYLRLQKEFVPDENYLGSLRKIQIRKYGLRIIARYSKGESLNAFIPYLAMNYFDRFVSRHPLPTEASDDKENIHLLAVCCLTIAWKMSKKSFSVTQFLRDNFLEIPIDKILEVECSILNGLGWRMRSITAFYFLNHYYYPKFKEFGGFKRRCIHEIIVQSLYDTSVTLYNPSVVAYSSLLAAADIAYAPDPEDLFVPDEDVGLCRARLFHVCKDKNIQIELATGEKRSGIVRKASSPDVAGSCNASAPVTIRRTSSDPAMILPPEEASPKKLWNFEVQWLTAADEAENLVIPPLETETLQETQGTLRETQGTSTTDSSNIGSNLGASILNRCCNIL